MGLKPAEAAIPRIFSGSTVKRGPVCHLRGGTDVVRNVAILPLDSADCGCFDVQMSCSR